MKLDAGGNRYLAQEKNGLIFSHKGKPYVGIKSNAWINDWGYGVVVKDNLKNNDNWRNTLIDLETDDYEFEEGILRRIEK